MTNFNHFDRPVVHFGNAEEGYSRPAPPPQLILAQIVPRDPILIPEW